MRKHRARNLKCRQQIRVPIQRLQIEKLRPARVRYIRRVNSVLRPAGKVPQKKRVDIPEKQFPILGFLLRSGNIFQQPPQLQAAEVRAQRQTGLRAKTILPSLARKSSHLLCHPRVLPHNGIRDWLPRAALPHHGRFPLVGDADRSQVGSSQVTLLQRFVDYLLRAPQYFQRIVLHPSWPRINLLVFPLRHRDDPRGSVKHHEPRACRPLIDCSDVALHQMNLCGAMHSTPNRFPAAVLSASTQMLSFMHLIVWDENWG